ncbi:hypothetical protein B5M09_013669 [Aphanomyces astaci]|uniref:Peptidase S1 domain-containing protein n=1 Tax=Aphanomyces astaci TaxID=112090 RepID=A0A3R7YJK8_APHAT|nr:hypothetical protein B5M09_013669 [Aphanomyces astaci]
MWLGSRPSTVNETEYGDSLIAPNVVLTAAHCLSGKLRSVVVGTHYLTGFADGELATVTEEIKHPNDIDVGIVILDRNITTIQPVAVSFRGTGPKSQVLKELNFTTWSNTAASDALFPIPVTDTMLGAGGVKGEDACTGDSGGSLTIEENDTVRLVGVSIWGCGCGRRGKPGVYARVSSVRDFIEPYLPK